jgi:type IV secretory pathway VirB4 component
LVFGKPGGGKSTATKQMLYNWILNPRFRKIFIIDPENEYSEIVKNFGGAVIDCSGLTTNSGRINPFEIYKSGDAEGEGSTDSFNA